MFIQKSVQVREQLHFADAGDLLKAVTAYCSDSYGSMLWSLQSDAAESYFKCWNTCVKLINHVPLSTFTYLVEGFFALDQVSLRNQVLGRYPGFFCSLLSSPSREVTILANIVSRDPSSNTAANLKYIQDLTQISPLKNTPSNKA